MRETSWLQVREGPPVLSGNEDQDKCQAQLASVACDVSKKTIFFSF